jgi:hypothetical protein
MESSSTVQTLQNAPLLGVNKPDEFDQEEHHITGADIAVVLASPPLVDEEEEKQEEVTSSYCYNFLIIWVLFPLLLFVQFGVALNVPQDYERSSLPGNLLSWSTVTANITLFCMISWLYRNACIDTKIKTTSYIVMFLPELILNTVLIVVTLNKTPLAFYTLLLGTELLNVLAIIGTVRYLYCSQVEDKDQEKEVSKDDYIMMV